MYDFRYSDPGFTENGKSQVPKPKPHTHAVTFGSMPEIKKYSKAWQMSKLNSFLEALIWVSIGTLAGGCIAYALYLVWEILKVS